MCFDFLLSLSIISLFFLHFNGPSGECGVQHSSIPSYSFISSDFFTICVQFLSLFSRYCFMFNTFHFSSGNICGCFMSLVISIFFLFSFEIKIFVFFNLFLSLSEKVSYMVILDLYPICLYFQDHSFFNMNLSLCLVTFTFSLYGTIHCFPFF